VWVNSWALRSKPRQKSTLLFEPFLNWSKEPQRATDIDVDFEHDSAREEVIQYIFKRYSRDCAKP